MRTQARKASLEVIEVIRKSGPYMKMPNIIMRMHEITVPTKFVFAFLLNCIRPEGGGKCYPRLRTISDGLSIPERTVQRSLVQLKKIGLLTYERVGLLGRNHYYLEPIPQWIIDKYSGPVWEQNLRKLEELNATDSAYLDTPDRRSSKRRRRKPSSLREEERNPSCRTIQDVLQKKIKDNQPKTHTRFGSKIVRDCEGSHIQF